MSEAKSIR